MREENVLFALHAERMAALSALGFRAGDTPSALAVLYTALQIAPLRRVYSWGIPTCAALSCVAHAAGGGLVEVGAGTGFWASLLAARGVDVRAYDAAPVDCGLHNGHHSLAGSTELPPPFLQVLRRSAVDAAAAHPGRALLLCWPPPEEGDALHGGSMAADALAAYRGDTVCFVGEGAPGVADAVASPATAGPLFFGALARDWTMQAHVPLPRWPSVRAFFAFFAE